MTGRLTKNEGSSPCRLLSLPPNHCCAVVESISEGVITIDLEKQVTYLNPAAEVMTGFSAQEAVGRQCFDILQSEHLRGLFHTYDQTREQVKRLLQG